MHFTGWWGCSLGVQLPATFSLDGNGALSGKAEALFAFCFCCCYKCLTSVHKLKGEVFGSHGFFMLPLKIINYWPAWMNAPLLPQSLTLLCLGPKISCYNPAWSITFFTIIDFDKCQTLLICNHKIWFRFKCLLFVASLPKKWHFMCFWQTHQRPTLLKFKNIKHCLNTIQFINC